MNGHAHFAAGDDLEPGFVQRVEGDRDGPDDRVLDGNYGVVDAALADRVDRVWEGAAGYRRGAIGPLLADGELAEGTELTLEGHAWGGQYAGPCR